MIPEALLGPTATEDVTRNAGMRRLSAGFAHPAVHSHEADLEVVQQHAEVFYLQKQIHSQTPMVIVLMDGERVEGCIEWYDGKALKVRGKTRTLIYKSAIKYMFKLCENRQ